MSLLSTGFGIDVTEDNIRIAWVNHKGEPKGLYNLEIPEGLVVDEKVVKPNALRSAVSKLFQKTELSKISAEAVLLAPDSRVMSTSFFMSGIIRKNESFEDAINTAQKCMPIPFSNAYVDAVQGVRVGEKIRTSVFAAEKTVIDNLLNVFPKENFTIQAVESNNAAICRLARVYGDANKIVLSEHGMLLIVDFRYKWANIALLDSMMTIAYSRSVLMRQQVAGKVDKYSEESIKKVCEIVREASGYFRSQGFELGQILIVGVDGVYEEVLKVYKKENYKCGIISINELVKIPGVTEKDIEMFGPAIGAALRAVKYKKIHSHNLIRNYAIQK